MASPLPASIFHLSGKERAFCHPKASFLGGLQVRAACCRRGSGRSAAAARSRLRGDLVLPGVGAATAAVRKGFATLVFVFEAAIDL